VPKTKPPAFYTPQLNCPVFKLDGDPVKGAMTWLAYFVTLARQPKLSKSETEELAAARGFLEEVANLLKAETAEFACATPTQRKHVSNEATDALNLVEAALKRQFRADLLDLI
jgi:hypothetical protein